MTVLDFVQIREELQANEIDVYPQKEFDEDAEDRIINDKIRVSFGYRQMALTLDIAHLLCKCNYKLFFSPFSKTNHC